MRIMAAACKPTQRRPYGVKRRFTFVVVAILFALGIAEVVCYFARRRLTLYFYSFVAENYAGHTAIFHPVLGWEPPKGDRDYDAVGARVSPAFPDPTTPPARLALW